MKRWLVAFGRCTLHVRVFLLFVMAGAFASGVFWTSSVAPPQETLTVLPADLNLGEVWQQPELKFSIPVRNRTRQAMRVADISTTCNCTQITPKSFEVPAGESVTLSGVIDLMRSIDRENAMQQEFVVGIKATLESRYGEQPVVLEWPLQGVARRALRVEPPTIDLLGAWEVVQHHFAPTVELEITPQLEIGAIKPEWNAREGDVVVTGPLEGNEYILLFTPSTLLPRGSVNTRINLRTVLANGSQGPDIEVPVRGEVVGPVRLSPERVTLRRANVIEVSSHEAVTVNIVSAVDTDWRLVDWSSTPEGIVVVTPKDNAIVISLGKPLEVKTGEAIDALTLKAMVESTSGERESVEVKVDLPGDVRPATDFE